MYNPLIKYLFKQQNSTRFMPIKVNKRHSPLFVIPLKRSIILVQTKKMFKRGH